MIANYQYKLVWTTLARTNSIYDSHLDVEIYLNLSPFSGDRKLIPCTQHIGRFAPWYLLRCPVIKSFVLASGHPPIVHNSDLSQPILIIASGMLQTDLVSGQLVLSVLSQSHKVTIPEIHKEWKLGVV